MTIARLKKRIPSDSSLGSRPKLSVETRSLSDQSGSKNDAIVSNKAASSSMIEETAPTTPRKRAVSGPEPHQNSSSSSTNGANGVRHPIVHKVKPLQLFKFKDKEREKDKQPLPRDKEPQPKEKDRDTKKSPRSEKRKSAIRD